MKRRKIGYNESPSMLSVLCVNVLMFEQASKEITALYPRLTLSCLGVPHHLWGFLPITQGVRKVIQPNLVTFLKIYRNLFKSKSLSMDPLLLPWQHFRERALRKDRVLQNSNDVAVMSFLHQSQHNFVILLEMLSCTFVPNLSKIV